MASATKTPALDRFGLRVQRGHTVHLGSSVGLVHRVSGELARVHFIYGTESWVRCSRLEVNDHLGRVRFVRGAV